MSILTDITGLHWSGVQWPRGVGYSPAEQIPPSFLIHWNGSTGCGQQSITRATLPWSSFPVLIAYNVSMISEIQWFVFRKADFIHSILQIFTHSSECTSLSKSTLIFYRWNYTFRTPIEGIWKIDCSEWTFCISRKRFSRMFWTRNKFLKQWILYINMSDVYIWFTSIRRSVKWLIPTWNVASGLFRWKSSIRFTFSRKICRRSISSAADS
jgi:hypothetical protein